jgi:hypothetical protein
VERRGRKDGRSGCRCQHRRQRVRGRARGVVRARLRRGACGRRGRRRCGRCASSSRMGPVQGDEVRRVQGRVREARNSWALPAPATRDGPSLTRLARAICGTVAARPLCTRGRVRMRVPGSGAHCTQADSQPQRAHLGRPARRAPGGPAQNAAATVCAAMAPPGKHDASTPRFGCCLALRRN